MTGFTPVRRRKVKPLLLRVRAAESGPFRLIGRSPVWSAWLVVSAAIIQALDGLKLEYPKVAGKALERLKKVERALKAE